jgi:hypothetical protein
MGRTHEDWCRSIVLLNNLNTAISKDVARVRAIEPNSWSDSLIRGKSPTQVDNLLAIALATHLRCPVVFPSNLTGPHQTNLHHIGLAITEHYASTIRLGTCGRYLTRKPSEVSKPRPGGVMAYSYSPDDLSTCSDTGVSLSTCWPAQPPVYVYCKGTVLKTQKHW